MELPTTEESKPLPASSSDSLPSLTYVAPFIKGCEQKEEKEPEPTSCRSARRAGSTVVHPSAAVTSEEKTDDEVDDEEDKDEEEEEDQEEEEDDGERAKDVEEIEGGTKPKKGWSKKAATKRKSAATDHSNQIKRSRAVKGPKSRAGKVEGAPMQSPIPMNAGKKKKTPVVERTLKALNTCVGRPKAQSECRWRSNKRSGV
ncbi:hypothetical protein M758_N014200 [Ceratodon purpureus]|nr:hypothetical protein M758_N014200 [Ceratodon purpureus]